MQKAPFAAWLTCVVALGTMLVSANVAAQKKPSKKIRAISSCVKYDVSQSDDGLNLSLDNTCELDVECSLTWTLRCDEGGKHPGRAKVGIAAGQAEGTFASADECGDDGWVVNGVKWSCQGADD